MQSTSGSTAFQFKQILLTLDFLPEPGLLGTWVYPASEHTRSLGTLGSRKLRDNPRPTDHGGLLG
jgi:hypothetical protein